MGNVCYLVNRQTKQFFDLDKRVHFLDVEFPLSDAIIRERILDFLNTPAQLGRAMRLCIDIQNMQPDACISDADEDVPDDYIKVGGLFPSDDAEIGQTFAQVLYGK